MGIVVTTMALRAYEPQKVYRGLVLQSIPVMNTDLHHVMFDIKVLKQGHPLYEEFKKDADWSDARMFEFENLVRAKVVFGDIDYSIFASR